MVGIDKRGTRITALTAPIFVRPRWWQLSEWKARQHGYEFVTSVLNPSPAM